METQTNALSWTWHYKYNPQEFVPEKNRAAWLAEHGVPPASAVAFVTATLAEWEALGAGINPDGSADPNVYACVARELVQGVLRENAAGGVFPDGKGGEITGPYLLARKREADAAKRKAEAEDLERTVAELIKNNGLRYGEPAFTESMRLKDGRELPPHHHAWARQVLATYERAQKERAAAEALRKEQEAFAEDYAAALRLETLRAGDLTASQRTRLEAGVLPEDEADEHLARLALGAVWDMPEYEPLQKTEVCGEYPSGVTFTKEEIKEYSDAAWKLRGEVLAACPGASITLTQHKGVCECRDHEYVYRTSMLVRARAPHGQVYSTRLKVDEKGGDTP
jgi:hypothetical protein